MPIQFNASPDPTIGVEVELQIVDPTTRQLAPKGGDLIASLIRYHSPEFINLAL